MTQHTRRGYNRPDYLHYPGDGGGGISLPIAISDVQNLSIELASKQVAGDYVLTNDNRLSDARTPTTHNHDDRYYTETEVDNLLSGLGGIGGPHNHDDRYYTETEVDTLLNGKQASGNYVLDNDTRLSDARTPTTHNHDDRYFTETEINNMSFAISRITGLQDALNAKQPTGNYILEGDVRLTNSRTPTTHSHPATDISDSSAAGRSMLTAVTAAAQTALLDTFGAAKGLVPPNGGATTTFLRANGTWATPTAASTQISRVLSADVVGGTVNTAQNPWGTLSAITLVADTLYEFELFLHAVRTVGTVSHTIGWSFGGAATLTSIDYDVQIANQSTTPATLTAINDLPVTSAANTALTAAMALANEITRLSIRGMVRVNAGGTFIPQWTYSAAPGGAPTWKRNSFIIFNPIGAGTVTGVN